MGSNTSTIKNDQNNSSGLTNVANVDNDMTTVDLKGDVVIQAYEIKLIRESWREMTKMGDFKKHGTIMMIK